ncbi:hypothetical protein [Ruminococcus sp.]|uniref:hypothetical protein n=1 Tax=Ruminococcus sp. TaxID=41978 RepID=UPI0025FA9244|nr:hypothetical protein [Ruminococcus sp.]
MVLILFFIGMVGIIAAFLLQILKISSTRRKNNIIVMILEAVSLAMIIWGIIMQCVCTDKKYYSVSSTVEETVNDISKFSLNQVKEKDTTNEKYTYSIGNANYEIYADSEDIYSIKMNNSKATKVTVQKNKYRNLITLEEKEMYCYIFD